MRITAHRNRRKTTFAARRIALLCGVVALVLPAQAQTTQPTDIEKTTIPYADYGFGFEMRLPAGWEYDRTRFVVPGGGVGLLRGRSKAGQRTSKLLIFRKDRAVEFDRWLKDFEAKLLEMPGTTGITRRTWETPGRPRRTLEVDALAGSSKTRSGYLCVPFDSGTVWVFVYGAVLSAEFDAEQFRSEFDQLGSSLRVLYTPEEAEEIAAGIERGRKLIERLRGLASSIDFDEDEQYYDITVKGKPIGYLTRRISRERQALSGARFADHAAKEGLRVREQSWRFADDGTVRFTKVDLFASFDFESEMIETRNTTIPAPDAREPLLITLDQCVRERDVIFSSYSTNLDPRLPDPRPPIKLGPEYLSLAWVRLLPALLGSEPGELHAVSIYDSPTRALVVQKMRALGLRPLPGRADSTVFAFESREGFAAQRNLLFTNERGVMQRLEAGELVIALSSPREIERKYGARRDEAQKKLARRRR